MAGDATFTPTKWAQRKSLLYVTFCVDNCTNTTVTFEPNKIIFHGQGGAGNKVFHSELELFKEIVPEKSKWGNTQREVVCTVEKKETNEDYWPRLLSTKLKQHWLKVDFARWNDEDDSSAEDDDMGGQPDLSEMMAQMGRGAGGGIDIPSDSDDSDDEDLPGLEDAPPEGAAEEKAEAATVENGEAGKTMEAQACDA